MQCGAADNDFLLLALSRTIHLIYITQRDFASRRSLYDRSNVFGSQSMISLTTAPPATPATAPTPATTDDAMIPPAPSDWHAATKLPAATGALADIMDAAMLPAAIPADVKPRAPRTTGAATTATPAPTAAPTASNNLQSITEE